MSIPYNLTCVTNMPQGIKECETYPLWDFPEVEPGNVKRDWDAYRRLKLFDPEVGGIFGDRILSIDLDVLIDGDLAPIIDEEKTFQGVKGAVSHINASLYTLKVGTNRHVWDTFDPKTAAKIIEKKGITGSDQGWMSVQMPRAYTWDGEDGVWTWKRIVQRGSVPESFRVVAYAGSVKPWSDEAKHKHKDLYHRYMSYYA